MRNARPKVASAAFFELLEVTKLTILLPSKVGCQTKNLLLLPTKTSRESKRWTNEINMSMTLMKIHDLEFPLKYDVQEQNREVD